MDLTVNSGEVHAIMGPNGSGKSTLAYAIAGHPKYEITSGSVTLDGVELTDLTVDERARQGLFLAMQYPVEVPGVSVANFLRTAKTALDGKAPKIRTWVKDVENVSHIREITRAVSLIDSPRPNWMSRLLKNSACPPSSFIPTSKV